MEFYIHAWYVYGVEMYKLVNSEWNWMNEKQVKLTEFMIAFENKSPLILIVNFCHYNENYIYEETSRGIGA